MFSADLLTVLLGVGVVVLVVSTTVMILTMGPNARQRRRAAHPLSPSAAHELALARARAAAQTAELVAGAPARALGGSARPAGQIIDISDDLFPGRGAAGEMTATYAQAIAEHVAETDPQFVAEVISQWIRADSSEVDVPR